VSVVIAVSIGLAVAVAFRPSRPLLWTIVALILLFATFDAAEIAHQIDESNNGVAIIAGVAAALHGAAAVLTRPCGDRVWVSQLWTRRIAASH
jgi:hypothetical protein